MRIASALSPILFLCVVLAGCGFAPGLDAQTTQRLAQIKVNPIAERQGQLLNTALRQALNPQGLQLEALYTLNLNLDSDLANSFSSATGTYRARGTLRATGTLQDGQGQTIWAGTATARSLLALEGQPSLSAAAVELLWQDLARTLARDLRLQLARSLRGLR